MPAPEDWRVVLLVDDGLRHCPGTTNERAVGDRQANATGDVLEHRFSSWVHGKQRSAAQPQRKPLDSSQLRVLIGDPGRLVCAERTHMKHV